MTDLLILLLLALNVVLGMAVFLRSGTSQSNRLYVAFVATVKSFAPTFGSPVERVPNGMVAAVVVISSVDPFT